jgi:hypothetical protein
METVTEEKNKKIAKWITAGIFLVIFIFMLRACASDSETASKPEVKANDKILALIMSHDFVKQLLKAPSTAEFSNNESHVTSISTTLGHEVYDVRSYVDSENSYGAKLRTWYTCRIKFDGDNANCENMHLEE